MKYGLWVMNYEPGLTRAHRPNWPSKAKRYGAQRSMLCVNWGCLKLFENP